MSEAQLDIFCYSCREPVLLYQRSGDILVRCPVCLQRASLSSAIVECQIFATDVEVLTEDELRQYPYRFMPAARHGSHVESLSAIR